MSCRFFVSPIDGLSLPTIAYMDGQDEQDETRRNYETTKLRNYENSESHKNAFILPILFIHVSGIFELM